MADRRSRQLADCRAVAGARRMRAEVQHARAIQEEEAAAIASQTAADALARAAVDWTKQMSTSFDPMLGAMLGRAVLNRATDLEAAEHRQRSMCDARARTAEDWRGDDAQWRSLNGQVVAAQRRDERKADERRVSALADRETFIRSNR